MKNYRGLAAKIVASLCLLTTSACGGTNAAGSPQGSAGSASSTSGGETASADSSSKPASTAQVTSIFDAMKRFLIDDDWPITPVEDGIVKVTFKGENGEWTCVGQAIEKNDQMLFYSIAPLSTPEDRRTEMARFLARANYGTILGNFELDLNDGEVRYKTSIDANGEELVPKLVQPIVYANVLMMDKYLPGIMAVATGNVSAEEAIVAIEGTPAE